MARDDTPVGEIRQAHAVRTWYGRCTRVGATMPRPMIRRRHAARPSDGFPLRQRAGQATRAAVGADRYARLRRPWLARRLGLRQAKECEVTWRDVLRFERGRLVVRAPRGKRKRKR